MAFDFRIKANAMSKRVDPRFNPLPYPPFNIGDLTYTLLINDALVTVTYEMESRL